MSKQRRRISRSSELLQRVLLHLRDYNLDEISAIVDRYKRQAGGKKPARHRAAPKKNPPKADPSGE